jgi:protein-S-isoprenylcysteine O-methyltransferase Ste14
MALKLSPLAGKIAYGGFFIVLLPLALWVWGLQLSCPFPPFHSLWIGMALLTVGALLMALAMARLWREGGGLPMNAFPPPRIATGGIYALLPHPIYIGFVLCCAGAAILSNSASALWIITPAAALGCLSLVLGCEGPALRSRFGFQLPEPWIGLPVGEGFLPLSRRAGTALAVLIPFAILYVTVKAMGIPAGAFETRLACERAIPVLPATMPVYASVYLIVPLVLLLCADRAQMRRLAAGAWLATGLNTLLYATVPATAAFRPASGNDWMSQWLAWEQGMATPATGSLPSFHVTWAVICAAFLARGPLRRCAALVWLWCAALSVSCLTTGMHSVADVLAGALTGAVCVRPEWLWRRMLDAVERLGNNWKAWHFGPLRVINHGLWSGLAGFAVLLIAGMSADAGQLWCVLLVASCALIGAGLFAQWVEGSSALLRPFGYYGSILGGLLALSIIAISRGPAAAVMAAFAMAAPWALAIGRLRCVVQGCCHGRPVEWGIRLTNPHSRAVKLAGYSGTPIHPAPLYSILSNIVIGLLLLRLRVSGAGPFQIAGLYLLLAGMSRFVEEAYRGEPQTRRIAGLPIYQWLAVASAVLGMILMALRGPSLPPLRAPTPFLLVASALWGAVSAFAMSMDFPASTRRFSRLTG